MNNDYRLKTDTLDHPKLLKLERLCGEHGVLCLIRLWGFTARYHPKGNLNGMSGEDIEIAARWHGVSGQLFQNLEQLKLIDRTESGYEIHDWKEHNAFCYHAPERSHTARTNIEMRWNKRLNTNGNTDGNTDGNTPLPTPTPTPKEVHKNERQAKPAVENEKFLSVQEPGKPKKPIMRLRKSNNPVYRTLIFWHKYYFGKHDRDYCGDAAKMSGQIKTILDKGIPFTTLAAGMNCFLDEAPDKFNNEHSFDTFIKRSNDYMTKAEKEGYEMTT